MSFKVVLGLLFGLLVASIIMWALVSYEDNKLSVETADLIRNAHEVLARTDEISSLVKDIQLESNAFFISGDSSLLQPYFASRETIMPRIQHLRKLTQGNRDQGKRVDSLHAVVKRLITFTNDVLKNNGSQREPDELNNLIKTSSEFRQTIRQIIERIKSDEQALLIKREQAHDKSIAAFNQTFLLLLSGISVLLVTTFLSIRYNFNKRIKAEEDQKKATELFTKLFYEGPMGIVISKLDTGEIIDCNKAYTELIKYNKSELIGRTAVQLGILNQRDEISDDAATQQIHKHIEIQLKPKDSKPIWASISMQSISINSEICLLTAVLDTTAHKEAEERIKQTLLSEIELNKLKSNFVTLASHEFRTPLTTISSSASLIESYAVGENREKVNKHVSRIKASVNLLTSILNEFLSLTKIEEGKVEPKKESINLKETLQSVCNSFKAVTHTGQTITYYHSGDEVVYSDPVLLSNIANNLISNAIKYSPENGDIIVSSSVNSNVHFSVKDHGIGISKEDQAHLFERFFRASNAGNVQGTGLGLHILKHYVDMLDGSIEVQSEPGSGSEFRVTFDRS